MRRVGVNEAAALHREEIRLQLLEAARRAAEPQHVMLQHVAAQVGFYLALDEMMHRHIERSTVGKPGAVHIFRHSMATHMLKAGCDVRLLQEKRFIE